MILGFGVDMVRKSGPLRVMGSVIPALFQCPAGILPMVTVLHPPNLIVRDAELLEHFQEIVIVQGQPIAKHSDLALSLFPQGYPLLDAGTERNAGFDVRQVFVRRCH